MEAPHASESPPLEGKADDARDALLPLANMANAFELRDRTHLVPLWGQVRAGEGQKRGHALQGVRGEKCIVEKRSAHESVGAGRGASAGGRPRCCMHQCTVATTLCHTPHTSQFTWQHAAMNTHDRCTACNRNLSVLDTHLHACSAPAAPFWYSASTAQQVAPMHARIPWPCLCLYVHLAPPIPDTQGTESKWNWSECWDEILKQEELDREKLKGMEVRASRLLGR